MGNLERGEGELCRLARLVGAESKASQQRTVSEVLSKASEGKKDEKGEYSKLSTVKASPTETKKLKPSSVFNETNSKSEVAPKSKQEPNKEVLQSTLKSGMKQDNIGTLKMQSSEKEGLVKENMAEASSLSKEKPTPQETKLKETQGNDAALKTPFLCPLNT